MHKGHMKKKDSLWKMVPYVLFLVLLLAFNGLIFLTPYLAYRGDASAQPLYEMFALTCHQLTGRSLCLFSNATTGSLMIGDCLPQIGVFYSTRENTVEQNGMTGYKFPVCARCVAIYLSMLVGLILLPFIMKIGSEDWPNKWILVAACVPIAIDGFTQLFGWRESTDFLRLVTGAIVGVVLPFYILPMLNSIFAMVMERVQK
jgi:uncharacterized membrane protein